MASPGLICGCGHQHHFELALEGELHHQILRRPWAGVGIDPYTHFLYL